MLVYEIIVEGLDRILPYKLVKTEQSYGVIANWYEIKSQPILTTIVNIVPFKNKKYAEVSFYSEETKFKTTNSNNAGSAGTVFGTLIDIYEQHKEEVDTWWFSAKFSEANSVKEFNKRTSLYLQISQRWARKNGYSFTTFTSQGDKVYIVSKEPISKQDILEFASIW